MRRVGRQGRRDRRVDQDVGVSREEPRPRSACSEPRQGLPASRRRLRAAGFEKTMSFVHGSQGCVAYYRSHLSRHFKEPASAVSSSMTEDAAVFGGLNNMVDGLANTSALYSPKMIAVSTTCMAEVIGDDLQSFIETAREQGVGRQGLPGPLRAHPGLRRQPHRRLRQHDKGRARKLLEGQDPRARTRRSTSFPASTASVSATIAS